MTTVTVNNDGSGRSVWFDYWTFVALTYLFSWSLLVAGVKLGWSEDLLNVSGAGPAIVAILLSRRGARQRVVPAASLALRFIVLLLLSWAVLILDAAWRDGPVSLPRQLNPWLLIPALGPTMIIMSAWSSDGGIRELGQRLISGWSKWTPYALLFFPVLVGIPSVIAYALGAKLIWPDRGGITAAASATAIVAFVRNCLFAGVQEEPGWRGFLLDRLQRRYSPLVATLLVWAPWALWHGPVDYYRPVRFSLVEEILLRVVTLIPLTIILTWFYNRSRRSILTVAMFHAAMNTFPYVFAYYQLAYLALFLAAAFAVVSDKMWRKS